MADALSNDLVIGHSFSRHLRDWSFRNNCMNLNLDRSRVTVFWQGTRGDHVAFPSSPQDAMAIYSSDPRVGGGHRLP